MIFKDEIITSRKNQTVVFLSSLSERKYRDKYDCFIADGYKLFCEAISSGVAIDIVCIAESKKEQYLQSVLSALAGEKYENTQVLILNDSCFEKISQEKSPQGIITIVKYLDKIKNNIKIYKVDCECTSSKILILDSVRDPSNLGAIFRSASAFGTDTIILSMDCADPYNSKTVRAAMGALFRLNVLRVCDLAQAVTALRESGRRVLAARLSEDATSLDEVGLDSQDVVVIGNEGHGISEDVSSACSGSVYLPIASTTESLNAAVAASIFLWEQR